MLQVSYTFCKDFIAALLKDMSCTEFGSTTVLIQAFQRVSKTRIALDSNETLTLTGNANICT